MLIDGVLSDGGLLLGVDSCGVEGSVALGRMMEGEVKLLGERRIAGGALSVGLVAAIADLLAGAGVAVGDLAGIAVVAGPGTFTGIRIGVAAVKALAEAAGLLVVAVSRLALLAEKAEAPCAVLDAHRGQVFCGFYRAGEGVREVLMTAGEVNAMGGFSGRVAVCEAAVAQWIDELVGEPEVVQVAGPTAADALRFGVGEWRAGRFADVAMLDGYYLRGADAKVAGRA